jgi:single-stranded DNA-binding protein
MSNETTITVTGNLVDDPELRFTPVSRGFRITEEPFAANPRERCRAGEFRCLG